MRYARYAFFLIVLLSCDKERFPGFRAVDDGVHFQLRALGDGVRFPTDSDSVLVRVRIARHGEAPGSWFSTEAWFGALTDVLPTASAGAISLKQGDSVSVIAVSERIPWTTIGASSAGLSGPDWVDAEYSLRTLRPRSEPRSSVGAATVHRTPADEDSTLACFFRIAKEKWTPAMGLHYRILHQRKGRPKVRSGQTVTITWTARFLDHDRPFDDASAKGTTLTFRLGDPGQVIKGLEIAVHLLAKGEKGRFVIPSSLAFGAEGSAGGIVPPWTPVLYDVEVTDVRTAATVAAVLADTARRFSPE